MAHLPTTRTRRPPLITSGTPAPRSRVVATDPAWARWLLTGVAVLFLALFLVVPLVSVFAYALEKGVGAYFRSFADSDTLAAIRLTLLTAAIAVPLNVVFGVT